jgi:hypothetical protein
MLFQKAGTTGKVIIMDAIIEDTLIDVKFSGLSWRGNEGFIIRVTRNQKEVNCLLKQTNINCIFINWEPLKKRIR